MPSTIKSENWDGVTPPSLPGVWVQADGSALVTSTLHPRSSPNSLAYPNGTADQATLIWGNPSTGILADARVSRYCWADSGLTHAVSQQVFCRYRGNSGASTPLSSAFGYAAYIVVNPGGTSSVGLDVFVSGGETTLAIVNISSFSLGAWYRVVLSAIADAIKVQVQRDSDGMWLDNTGAWVTDGTGGTTCISVLNSAVIPAGYAGLGWFCETGADADVRTDDWLFEDMSPTPPPLLVGTCYVGRSSDTALTIDGTPAQQGSQPYTYQLQRATDGVTFTNFGSAQTGVTAGTPPTTVIDSGLTTGAIYYYRWVVTDSETPTPVTVTSNVSSMSPRAVGQTYYVDPAGSDGNAGTSSGAAWASLAHASAFGLTLGDSLLLKDVTHTGNLLYYWVPGTYAAPLVITSYGTGKATISSGDVYGIRLVRCSGINLSNLIVSGSGAFPDGTSTSLYNGIEVINPELSGTLPQCWIDNVETTGSYAGIEVRGCSTGAGGSGYTDVRITNCYAREVLYFGGQVRCVMLIDKNGKLLTWNTFSLVNDRGSAANNFQIFAGRSFIGVYVANCRVVHSYGDPLRDDSIHSGDGWMVKNTTYAVVERSNVSDCGAKGYGPAGIWMQEVKFGWMRWCEVRRQSSITLVDGDAYDMDGGCDTCTVEYCYSHGSAGAGVLCGPYSGSAPPVNCTVRYHTSVNDAQGPTNATAAIFPYELAQIDVYNCTLYMDDSSTAATALIVHGGGQQRMWNNIFLTNRTDDLPFTSGTFNNGSLAIGNLYWAAGSGGPKWNWGGANYTTLSAFRTGSGQESLHSVNTGIYADPLLTSPGSHPDVMPAQTVAVGLTAYDQTASSPGINAGIDLFTLYGIDPGQVDMHGYPLRAGADLTHTGFDIGPTKYGTGNLIPSQGGSGRFRVTNRAEHVAPDRGGKYQIRRLETG